MTQTKYRTHTCGELRMENVGQTVTVAGWLENLREVGSNLGFLVLRDMHGVTQVVIETEEMMAQVKAINKESVLAVTGAVRERASKNPKLPTGDIEVVPSEIQVLGRCRHNELPFEVNYSKDAGEDARLKYRYLDLRNPQVKGNIVLRSQVVSALRRAMEDQGFLEITTPILTASSPEGARDYLVPSRKHPGKFYALPQAPQQFKQLLMASGFDKYFQIAPCFRDEDARGDRSPGEFYQLDMEMAFAGQEDVFTVIDRCCRPSSPSTAPTTSPLRRPSPASLPPGHGGVRPDKPDLRIDLRVKDVTDLVRLRLWSLRGELIKAGRCRAAATRKATDKLCADVESRGAEALLVHGRQGRDCGRHRQFLNADPALAAQVKESLSLENDTLVLLYGTRAQVWKTSGVMVKMAGAQCEGHMDTQRYAF
ncbi:MAG: amino acid--tRNA ligase-related protein [Acutalibacter sp.]